MFPSKIFKPRLWWLLIVPLVFYQTRMVSIKGTYKTFAAYHVVEVVDKFQRAKGLPPLITGYEVLGIPMSINAYHVLDSLVLGCLLVGCLALLWALLNFPFLKPSKYSHNDGKY